MKLTPLMHEDYQAVINLECLFLLEVNWRKQQTWLRQPVLSPLVKFGRPAVEAAMRLRRC